MFDPRTSPTNSYTGSSATMNIVEENGNLSQENGITCGDWYNEVQFWPFAMNDDDSRVFSKSSPSPSRMSPDSRADAIARGRSELMEMVGHMPESNYELSLKDIVEHHIHNHRAKIENESMQRGVVKVKRGERKRIERNLIFEKKGLLLNMVFPFPFLSNKKKKNGGSSDISRTSDNSGTSATTVSSGATAVSGDQRGRRINGCFHFFQLHKMKQICRVKRDIPPSP